jgi:hypothetical protein
VIRRVFTADRMYWVAVAALAAVLVMLIGFMVVNIAIPELERSGVIAAVESPTPVAQAEALPSARIEMGGASIPESAECSGCHMTTAGTIGVRTTPKMGHVLEGWSECANCHAPDRLVDTAPGHSGIHATQCTVCHEPGDPLTPLSRPHRDNQNEACLNCHGKTAPLPSDMAHRNESVCWLCHRLPVVEPPVPAHDTAPGEADCLTCHVAQGKAGALPRDHVARPASLCLSCHEVALGMTPSGTPRITRWPAPSSAASAAPAAASPSP